jgi:hypothetical protein
MFFHFHHPYHFNTFAYLCLWFYLRVVSDGKNYTISRGSKTGCFYGGSKTQDFEEYLTISNLTFDGAKIPLKRPMIDYTGKTATFNNVTVQNCFSAGEGNYKNSVVFFTGQTLVLNGFQAFGNEIPVNSRPSCVFDLEAYDTTITGNTSIHDNTNSSQNSLGIVYCNVPENAIGDTTVHTGVVTLESGEMYNNKTRSHSAGVITLHPTVNMTLNIKGGKIHDNQTRAVQFLASAGGSIHMSGGSIENNTAGEGGGMFTRSVDIITIDGDSIINGNTATTDGGGIYVRSMGSGNITIGGDTAIMLRHRRIGPAPPDGGSFRLLLALRQ